MGRVVKVLLLIKDEYLKKNFAIPMMQESLNCKSFGWGQVIIFLFLFFPIGIWMLYKKMITEKFKYYDNGKNCKYLSYVLLVSSTLVLLFDLSYLIKIAIIIVILGICLFAYTLGDRYQKIGNNYLVYFYWVVEDPNN
ncbi:MAG: hypothetical protein WBO70_07070, partial [Erysipelotrichaceae bacterium]